MTTTLERYYGDYDRGHDDYAVHADHVEAVLRKLPGITTGQVHDTAMSVITADTHPRSGIDPYYARALDDVFMLRRTAAYEARVIEAHYEGMTSFPKTRLPIAQTSVTGLRQVATGNYMAPYRAVARVTRDGFTFDGVKTAYEDLGLSSNLTNWQYEQERPLVVETAESRAVTFAGILETRGLGDRETRADIARRLATLPESQPSRAYSEAVTEIYSVRGIFAVEAHIMDGHLAMKSFPKSRRPFAEEQARAFAELAAGKSIRHGASSMNLAGAAGDAGMSPTLSRAEFESAAAHGLWGLMPASK